MSIDIEGPTAIVGAIGKPTLTNPKLFHSGAAYIIDAASGNVVKTLNVDFGEGRDGFGSSVAIAGNVAIVGSPAETDVGAAYVFDVTTGAQRHKLTPSGGEWQDFFGSAVALSDNTAVIGAPTAENSGYVSVFDLVSGTERMRLAPLDCAERCQFGRALAVGGNRIVIGAPNDPHAGIGSGSVYVFDLTTGEQLLKLTTSDANASDRFGSSVSIDGNQVLIGTPTLGYGPGAAYLFDLNTGAELLRLVSDAPPRIVELPLFTTAYYDFFGLSVALDNNLAMIGAPDDNAEASGSGAVYFFDTLTGTKLNKLKSMSPQQFAGFGVTFATNQNILLAGFGDDDAPGKVEVLARTPEPSSALLLWMAGMIVSVSSRGRKNA